MPNSAPSVALARIIWGSAVKTVLLVVKIDVNIAGRRSAIMERPKIEQFLEATKIMESKDYINAESIARHALKIENQLADEQVIRERFYVFLEDLVDPEFKGALCSGCASGESKECLECGIERMINQAKVILENGVKDGK